MTGQDDAHRTILHALRLGGVSDAAAVSERTNLAETDVLAVLATLAGQGHVRQWTGAHAGWQATQEGRRIGEQLLGVELDAATCRAQFADAYNDFLPLNADFLALCSDWQTKTLNGARRPNDHLDDRYDRLVIKRLAQMHRRITPVLAGLTDCLARFSTYEDRFSKALAHVESGLQDWFTKPGMDSYHSVWFELHEDLLATLGLDRAEEHRQVTPNSPEER